MTLLVLARLLVRTVPLHRWRDTLGRVGASGAIERGGAEPSAAYREVARSVTVAAGKLPGDYVCLPRAMTVQWMLRRRGLASALVFGVAPQQSGEKPIALHAWVEGGGAIIIGDDPSTPYARGLMLVQP